MTNLNEELQQLSDFKYTAENSGHTYKADNAQFKEHQTKCLDLMEAQGCKSWRGEDGTLFTRVEDRVKGQVEDRRLYIRWALEQDEAVQEFVNRWRQPDSEGSFEEDFFDMMFDLELVSLKENGTHANALAASHINDEAPLPPGLTFRPDPYIQQRRS